MPSFGRYTLLRPIGKGGMGEIWKAKVKGPEGFEKILALKTVLPDLAEDRVFVSMFIEEAKLSAQLVHPNVVQVFDFGQIEGRYYLAMEYVAGSNLGRFLSRLIDRGIPLPVEVATFIALEATRGLGYAHTRTDATGKPLAIVHRDISPQNLLVGAGGEVKVTDFGIARATSAISRTESGHVRGKVAYMSPEQAATQPLNGRSDLFCVGLILWEMVTGSRFFPAGGSEEVYARVLGLKPLQPAELAPIPEALREVIGRLLHPDPALRPDAAQLEVELGAAIGFSGMTQAKRMLGSMVDRLFAADLSADTEVESLPDPRLMGMAGGNLGLAGTQAPTAPMPSTPSLSLPVPVLVSALVSAPATTILPQAPRWPRLLAWVAAGGALAGLAMAAAVRLLPAAAPVPTPVVVAAAVASTPATATAIPSASATPAPILRPATRVAVRSTVTPPAVVTLPATPAPAPTATPALTITDPDGYSFELPAGWKEAVDRSSNHRRVLVPPEGDGKIAISAYAHRTNAIAQKRLKGENWVAALESFHPIALPSPFPGTSQPATVLEGTVEASINSGAIHHGTFHEIALVADPRVIIVHGWWFEGPPVGDQVDALARSVRILPLAP